MNKNLPTHRIEWVLPYAFNTFPLTTSNTDTQQVMKQSYCYCTDCQDSTIQVKGSGYWQGARYTCGYVDSRPSRFHQKRLLLTTVYNILYMYCTVQYSTQCRDSTVSIAIVAFQKNAPKFGVQIIYLITTGSAVDRWPGRIRCLADWRKWNSLR